MKKTIVISALLVSMAFAAVAQTSDYAAKPVRQSEFALRINLPYLAVATPFVGFEWKPIQKFGILVNGAWSDWSWKDGERHFGIWQVNPELRYYFNRCWYIGASGEKGYFNIKTNDYGRNGSMQAGGITGGYKVRMTRALDLDFNLGVGYAVYVYDKFTGTDSNRTLIEREKRYWWGPYQAAIALSWKICQ